MAIRLSDHFTYGKLFKFAAPSVIMMVFSSIYGVVDGIFVSEFVGTTEFAAVNLIMPIFMIIGALGFMMGAGGTAIVAKTLGEGDGELANKYFTLFVIVTATAGAVMAALGVIFLRPLSAFLGADGALFEACVRYGRIVVAAMPFFMLQNLFQSFFIVAEKPKLGLAVTVAAGVTNMVLDALLVAVIPIGLEGAALATSISQAVGGLVPLFYFSRKNSGLLRFTRTKFYGKALLRATTNGSSELMSNVSASVVTMLYNMQLMKLVGEDGVAAYGAIMYVGFIFIAMLIGYAIGTAPIVGYHYGAKNTDELKSLLRKSTVVNLVAGAIMTTLAFVLARPLSTVFANGSVSLLEMTSHGFRIFAFSFIFSGFCIYGSSFFTALNDGLISAIISFMRTLVFQMLLILILPAVWGLDGVWFSTLIAEVLAFVTTLIFIFANRKKYNYM
ncbi:MAG: MATE family efflux transporter [Clostridia bacterium]|nr:MATE family efflux transporter [Clostridia bacterium]